MLKLGTMAGMIVVDKDYVYGVSREERRAHLRLDTPCIERGGCSRNHRGNLSQFLNTTIPEGKNICLCHACHNGKCSNPEHLYWGSDKDNLQNRIENGNWKSIHQYSVEKYGADWPQKKNSSPKKHGAVSR